MQRLKRRDLLVLAGSALACACRTGIAATILNAASGADSTEPSPRHLPRWRGFNLLEKFAPQRPSPFVESDFDLAAGWGFDFVRLPLSYHCWADESAPRKVKESELAHIDEAVRFGRARNIHVSINLHRIPGYCVNPPKELRSIWTDPAALDDAAWMWAEFARRYKGIPSRAVSFDLINEPPDVPEAQYVAVVKRLAEAIRAEDSDRLIIADGLRWGQTPVWGLLDVRVGQSTRGYQPFRLTHFAASWVEGSDKWHVPTWPMDELDDEGAVRKHWDAAELRRTCVEPWIRLRDESVGVHVGEWGAHNRTPHDVTLKWMRDLLTLWKQANLGWALWNLRGSFGVLDSGRQDVSYESIKVGGGAPPRKLDRAMLELLREM